MKNDCLILLAHGSRQPAWRGPFEEVLQALQKERGADRVRLAFMELAPPSLPEVVGQLVAAGAARIQILPMFMARGNHFERDIPEQKAELLRQHPGVQIEILPPIGSHPRFVELLLALVRDSVKE